MAKKKRKVKRRAAAKRPLEIAFTGDVFTVFFEIDGEEVTLHADPGGGLKKTFEDFPAGTIEILLHVKGLNTTKWALLMKYDGKTVVDEKDKISGGFSRFIESVTLS